MKKQSCLVPAHSVSLGALLLVGVTACSGAAGSSESAGGGVGASTSLAGAASEPQPSAGSTGSEGGSSSLGGAPASADAGAGGSPTNPGQFADNGAGGSSGVALGGRGGAAQGGGGASHGGGAGRGGSGAGGTGGAPSNSSGPTLPVPQQPCAPFVNGKMTILGVHVSVWVGTPTATQHGPVAIYWHGTGTSGQEAKSALGNAGISEIVSEGGLVVAPEASTKQGSNTGNGVWYTGDFAVADEVVACAARDLHVDTRRIHSLGYSAGGLQTAWMASARSNYLASVVTYSGGIVGRGVALQDPSNVPPTYMLPSESASARLAVKFPRLVTLPIEGAVIV